MRLQESSSIATYCLPWFNATFLSMLIANVHTESRANASSTRDTCDAFTNTSSTDIVGYRSASRAAGFGGQCVSRRA